MLETQTRTSIRRQPRPQYSYIGDYVYNHRNLLGQGFSSKVYKGINSTTKKQVAIKVINTDILDQPINVTLLQSQLEVLETMKDCQHILEMHSIIRKGKDTYIVTQVCQTDLENILIPLLPIPTVEKYFHQLLRGYKQIFSKDVIHRDLKSANLLIDSKGNLKIADFGFAIKSSQAKNQSRYNIGSPIYMSPQVLKGNQYSFKSDIWSMGIILYEMLTGKTPWKAENEDELYEKLQKIKIEDIVLNQNFPQHINNFLVRTLQFQTQNRISPQQLILMNFMAKQSVSRKQQISVNTQIKAQKLLYVPKTTKATKTQKFYKANTNSTNDMNKTHKKDSIQVNQTPIPISIKPLRKGLSTKTINNDTLMHIPYQNKQQGSNSSAKTIGSHTITCSQQMQKQQKPKVTKQELKQITKDIVYYIHFCRLLYKDLVRIDQCIAKKLNETLLNSLEKTKSTITKIYCDIIVKYMHKVKNVANNNFIDLPQNVLDEYVNSGQYRKVRKVTTQYIQKYSKSEQLKYLWIQRQEPDLKQAIQLTTNLISQLWPQLCQRNHQQIILLQFLIFTREAMQALQKGSFKFLTDKERIQDYVDTIPNPPSMGRFKRAIGDAKKISLFAKKQLESINQSEEK